jgi:hypothetical protein
MELSDMRSPTPNTIAELDTVSGWAMTKGIDLDTEPFNKVAAAAKEEAKEPVYWQDKLFWRLVLYFIGVPIIIAFIGAIFLSFLGKEVPEIIVTATST